MKKITAYSLLFGMFSILLLYLEVFVLKQGIIYSLVIGMIFTFFFALVIGFYERSKRGGFITYVESVKFLFSILAIGTIISFIASFIIMKIDPSIVDYFVESTIESTRELNQKLGESPIELEEEFFRIEEELRENLQGMGLLINMITNSLTKIFYALLISIFIKKEKPTL